MRKTIFILFLLFSSLSYSQTKEGVIQKKIDWFCHLDGFENAIVSFKAYDLMADSVLAEINPTMAMPSASTAKLFTTAAALELLGEDYRPKTVFYYSGSIDSLGVLNGDIIVRGLGDPTLGSRYFTTDENKNDFLKEWVDTLSKLGIHKINGKIIADGSAFGYKGTPDGWTWIDMGNYYGAGASACAIYDNTTYLHFSTSYSVGGPTHLDSLTPDIPGYVLNNYVTSSRSRYDCAYIYGSPFSYVHFARGTLPRGKSNFTVKASVPDPEYLFARTLKQALEKNGIRVSQPAVGWRILRDSPREELNYADFHKLFTYKGMPLIDIIDQTNLHSVNFFAEQILSLIGLEEVGTGDTDRSIRFLNNFWRNRLDINMYQTDGCGLSRKNAFSAEHFIRLLKYMHQSDNFKSFIESLPVAGESGTLTSVCDRDPARGRMKAKSGTLHHVKAYSGYINSQSGHLIAFAIIINNYRISTWRVVKRMESVFNTMATY